MNNGHDETLADSPSRGRETFLSILLTVLVGGGFTLFLIFASGGFFFYVLVIAGGLGLSVYLNYLLWGRRYSAEVQAEREALLRREEEEAEPWHSPPPPWERRF